MTPEENVTEISVLSIGMLFYFNTKDDAIVLFTITAQILPRSLANFYRQ